MPTIAFAADRPVPAPAWLKRPGIRTLELTDRECEALRSLMGGDTGRIGNAQVDRLLADIGPALKLSGLNRLADSLRQDAAPVHVRLG